MVNNSPITSATTPASQEMVNPPPRRIHLMRHAQALHNVPPYNSSLLDPCLTLAGIQQTFSFTHHFLYTNDVSVILTSPMTRTLQTAVLCFPGLARPWEDADSGKHHHHDRVGDDGKKEVNCRIFAMPELQETSAQPCDTGSSREHLEAQFVENGVDFSRVKEGWNVKTGIMGSEREAVMERARMVRRELGELFGGKEGGDVVVVSHAGFLHYLVKSTSPCSTPPKAGTPSQSTTPCGSSTPSKLQTPPKSSTPTSPLIPASSPSSTQQWQNTEYRTFNLHQSESAGEWELIETAESMQRRYMAVIMGAGYGGIRQA